MRKALGLLFGILLLANMASAKTVSFGLYRSYGWTNEVFSTLANVQSTNISTYDATDGWLTLAYNTPTNTKVFSNQTGWTEANAGGGDTLLRGTVIYQKSGTGYTDQYNATFGAVDTTSALTVLAALRTPSPNTGTTTSGLTFYGANGTHLTRMDARSDGKFIDLYINNNAGDLVKYDTTIPADTRWHLFGFYNPTGAADKVCATVDGIRFATNAQTYAYAGIGGQVGLDAYPDGTTQADHFVRQADYFSYPLQWTGKIATLETDPTKGAFTAEAGSQWGRIQYGYVLGSGAAITIEARAAATVAQVTLEAYQPITVSGGATKKGQVIQVRVQMTTTTDPPVLQYLHLITVPKPLASMGKRGIDTFKTGIRGGAE